jgi:hypothetical protein
MQDSLPPKPAFSRPKPPVKPKVEKFEWHDEGISTLVRVIILVWSGAILTLNYVSVPGLPQKQIDPTFIASVFTSTLVSFGVDTGKKKKEDKDEKDQSTKEK